MTNPVRLDVNQDRELPLDTKLDALVRKMMWTDAMSFSIEHFTTIVVDLVHDLFVDNHSRYTINNPSSGHRLGEKKKGTRNPFDIEKNQLVLRTNVLHLFDHKISPGRIRRALQTHPDFGTFSSDETFWLVFISMQREVPRAKFYSN